MRVFITAGEASGDRLGAALMAGLRDLSTGVSFEGVGGPLMQGQGLSPLFPMSDINLMGITEILSRYRFLKRRIRETAEAVIAAKPDVLITVDLPEFSLRVAKLVKARSDIRVVHYVAPTVWAWRPGRAAKMAAHVDQVLALLPFEPPHMEAAGMRCDFVGHPVVTEPVADRADLGAFRDAHGLGDDVLCVLPGSRRSEIQRLAPVFGEVVRALHQGRPGLQVILPVATGRETMVEEAVAGWRVPPILLSGLDARAKSAAFQASRAALAASGTVSLELAAAGCPMVIAYDMGWLSRQIIGWMLLTDTVTLVNLVSETRAVPEFIGDMCRPGPIAAALGQVMEDPGAQVDAMAATMDRLGRGGERPGLRAAQAVIDGLA